MCVSVCGVCMCYLFPPCHYCVVQLFIMANSCLLIVLGPLLSVLVWQRAAGDDHIFSGSLQASFYWLPHLPLTHTHTHINTLSLSTLLWTIWMIFNPGIITQQVCLSWLISISSGLMHDSSSWSDVLPSLARRKVQLSRKPIRFHQLALISRGKLVLAAVFGQFRGRHYVILSDPLAN